MLTLKVRTLHIKKPDFWSLQEKKKRERETIWQRNPDKIVNVSGLGRDNKKEAAATQTRECLKVGVGAGPECQGASNGEGVL